MQTLRNSTVAGSFCAARRAVPGQRDVGGVERELEFGGHAGGDVVEEIGRQLEDCAAARALGVQVGPAHEGVGGGPMQMKVLHCSQGKQHGESPIDGGKVDRRVYRGNCAVELVRSQVTGMLPERSEDGDAGA